MKKRNIKNLLSQNITTFPAKKAKERCVYTEGSLEPSFCYHLEFDNDVTFYEAQPIGFSYWYKGEKHFYTPDFYVEFKSSKIPHYYEVKYEHTLVYIDDFDGWIDAVREAAKSNGFGFILVTDKFITRQFLFENLCLLYRCVNSDVDEQHYCWIKSELYKNSDLTINDLLRDDFRSSDFDMVYRLIWEKKIIVDLDVELLSIFTHVKSENSM